MATLYRRFERVHSRDLALQDVLRFTDSRWTGLAQTRKALSRIRRKYLNEEELVLLELLSMASSKSNRGIADVLKINIKTARSRRSRLYELIVAYSWWIQNEQIVRDVIRSNLSPLHLKVILQIIHRRQQRLVVKNLGVTTWCVHKKLHDCLVLLEPIPDWVTFLRSLRMRYYT